MIEYDDGSKHMYVQCDTCDDWDEFYGTFLECIDEMKKEGRWQIIPLDSKEYQHVCLDCQGS
jgi:hypothetical protein